MGQRPARRVDIPTEDDRLPIKYRSPWLAVAAVPLSFAETFQSRWISAQELVSRPTHNWV